MGAERERFGGALGQLLRQQGGDLLACRLLQQGGEQHPQGCNDADPGGVLECLPIGGSRIENIHKRRGHGRRSLVFRRSFLQGRKLGLMGRIGRGLALAQSCRMPFALADLATFGEAVIARLRQRVCQFGVSPVTERGDRGRDEAADHAASPSAIHARSTASASSWRVSTTWFSAAISWRCGVVSSLASSSGSGGAFTASAGASAAIGAAIAGSRRRRRSRN